MWYREPQYSSEPSCVTKLTESGEAADGAVRSCSLRRDVMRAVRGIVSQFVVIGFA
jgi:hypothetical protein